MWSTSFTYKGGALPEMDESAYIEGAEPLEYEVDEPVYALVAAGIVLPCEPCEQEAALDALLSDAGVDYERALDELTADAALDSLLGDPEKNLKVIMQDGKIYKNTLE